MSSGTLEYNYSFVESLPKELSCVICMNVLQHPQMVNCCENLFCERCLTKWRSTHHSCPCCRSSNFTHMEMQTTARKIGTLKVHCPNFTHGCQVKPALIDYNLHLSEGNQDGCLYVKVSCPNNCMADIFRCDLNKHCSTDCPKRQATCIHCGERGWNEYIKGDHQNLCPLFPIPCPLHCGSSVPHNQLASHSSSCPMEIVACSFEGNGCTKKVHRKELDDHLANNLMQHLLLLSSSQAKLKESMISMEKEYKELQQRNMAIENKLSKVGTLVKSLRNKPSKIDLKLAQLDTVLTDLTITSIGSSIAIELAKENGHGYHFIVVQNVKFKLTWVYKRNSLEFQLFLTEPMLMPTTMKCDIVVQVGPHDEDSRREVKAASIRRMLAVICCGKSQTNEDIDTTDLSQIALGPPKIVYKSTDISLTVKVQEHGLGPTPDDSKQKKRAFSGSFFTPMNICQCDCHTSHHRQISMPTRKLVSKGLDRLH